MSKRSIWILILVLLIIGLIILLNNGVSDSTVPSQDNLGNAVENGGVSSAVPVPGSSGVQETEVISAADVVTYTNGGFNPSIIEVRKGESVIWINESSRNMWVASAIHPTHKAYDGTSLREHCNDAGVTPFDACRSISPGAEWSFNFDRSGEWGYHDHVNAFRTGKVVVSE